MEKLSKFVTTLRDIPAIIRFLPEIVRVRQIYQEVYRFDSDMFPLPYWLLLLSTLKPENLKRWTPWTSAFIYGASIFNETFPVFDNPDGFDSSGDVVNLIDKPIQKLGWEAMKQRKREGEDRGLDYQWIDFGFEWQAGQRGIDLEWHFHEQPES